MRVLDLFSGIGGFSLGLERAGMQTVAFCEIETYCQKVLRRHWPHVPIYEDIRELTADTLQRDGIAVDVICGGFPCQDLSVAGAKAGLEGRRSGLWSEIVRLTRDIRPRYIIVENVTNLLNGPSVKPGEWFGRILGDLAALGYDAEWECIRADSVGVPQRRDRVWIVAYTARDGAGPVLHQNAFYASSHPTGLDATCANEANTNNESGRAGALPVLVNAMGPAVFNGNGGGIDDRVSLELDRYKALGNAVVPQIPEMIGRAIMEVVE